MAGLRAFSCYRKVKRAYTRKSKYRAKGYVRAVPVSKVIKFDQGDLKKEFESKTDMLCKDRIQIRHNAIESARQVINRKLSTKLGKNYHLQVRVVPHHVLRENKMLTGAGADRMQTGMQKAFGKAMGLAAQIKIGQPIFSVFTDKKDVEFTKVALKAGIHKLPCKCSVIQVK